MPVEITDLPIEINGNKLTLQWSKPGDNGRPIIHYTVYQKIVNNDGSTVTDWTFLKTVNQRLECEVSGMETGKTYEFQVTATNKCGEGPKVPELIKRVKVSIGKLSGFNKRTFKKNNVMRPGAIMVGDRKREIWPCPYDMGQNFYF